MKDIMPQIAANPKQNTYKEKNTVPKKTRQPSKQPQGKEKKKRERYYFQRRNQRLRTDLSTEKLEDSTIILS